MTTTIAFFNNKGGVGRTSLIYHLAYMFAHQGLKVVAADCDPQATLTEMFLGEERLASLWSSADRTLLAPLLAMAECDGRPSEPHLELIDGIGLLAGDLGLGDYETQFSAQWGMTFEGDAKAHWAVGGFHRLFGLTAKLQQANVVLVDLAPNLGAINRAVLLAADIIVIPIAPDALSVRGLETTGAVLRYWRQLWTMGGSRQLEVEGIPQGKLLPLGYVVLQQSVRLDRPIDVDSLEIPSVYREAILGVSPETGMTIARDPHCLFKVRSYQSLWPLARAARKPMFFLKPADGALGGHAKAVQECFRDYRGLAVEIARRAGLDLP